MSHPAFELIEQIDDHSSAFYRDYNASRARYKEEVYDMPVWTPGMEAMGANGPAIQVNFMRDEVDGALTLPVFLSQAQAIEEAGPGKYLAYAFSYVLRFSSQQRFTMMLVDGEDCLAVEYPLQITLRDLATLGDATECMADEATVEHGLYARFFAIRARDYCALHADIDSLHVVRLAMPGVRTAVVAVLKAGNYDAHSLAIAAIGEDIFLPGWRVILSRGEFSPEFPVEQLLSEPPVYERQIAPPKPLRWWQKLGKPHLGEVGEIPLVQVAFLPE